MSEFRTSNALKLVSMKQQYERLRGNTWTHYNKISECVALYLEWACTPEIIVTSTFQRLDSNVLCISMG